jgi:hypothetical protein
MYIGIKLKFNYVHQTIIAPTGILSIQKAQNKTMSSNTDISTFQAAMIQRRIQIAIGITLYAHYFLSRQAVHTSIRTGHLYTEEILCAHPRRALEII